MIENIWWDNITEEILDRLIDSMPTRLQAVIDAEEIRHGINVWEAGGERPTFAALGVGGFGVCDLRSNERLGVAVAIFDLPKKYLIVQADIKRGRV